MRRLVSADLELEVRTPSDLVLSLAAAAAPGLEIAETLVATLDGEDVPVARVDDVHGGGLHRVRADSGRLTLRYEARAVGRGGRLAVTERELIGYLRPSRYCESDTLAPTALAEFAGLDGIPLLDAVSSWVGTRLTYVPGSSLPTDGAVRTLLARQGVCRDFSHLCVALLRGRGVPARVVSVYAPGLEPMDFHAVCEAYVGDRWLMVDPTALAPRPSMLRIATGRDAADTAFLTAIRGRVDLVGMEVSATVDALPSDDVTPAVELG